MLGKRVYRHDRRFLPHSQRPSIFSLQYFSRLSMVAVRRRDGLISHGKCTIIIILTHFVCWCAAGAAAAASATAVVRSVDGATCIILFVNCYSSLHQSRREKSKLCLCKHQTHTYTYKTKLINCDDNSHDIIFQVENCILIIIKIVRKEEKKNYY